MRIQSTHPRAESLRIRELLVRGVKKGITSQAGLLAHGRGEAFDYLVGESTHPFATEAITAAAALLLVSKYPVLSVNGNTAALVAGDYARLADLLNCPIEVNLFHHSKERIRAIETHLSRYTNRVLSHSSHQTVALPEIASARRYTLSSGIASADTVFVPLEDGDRCAALISQGKRVITIDLNPLSRTSRTATVTIIDNIVRAMPLLVDHVRRLKSEQQSVSTYIVRHYNNSTVLSHALSFIKKRLDVIIRS